MGDEKDSKAKGFSIVRSLGAETQVPTGPGTDAYRRETPFGEKLRELYRRVGYMRKGGRMQGSLSYSYLQEAEVKARINQALQELGLVILKTEFVLTTGSTVKDCLAKATIVLADAYPKPTEHYHSIQLEGLGGGTDRNDKGPMKAGTAAVKNAWMHGLAIATGDDPEQVEEDPAAELTRTALLEALEQVGDLGILQLFKADVRSFEGKYLDGEADPVLREAFKAKAKVLGG